MRCCNKSSSWKTSIRLALICLGSFIALHAETARQGLLPDMDPAEAVNPPPPAASPPKSDAPSSVSADLPRIRPIEKTVNDVDWLESLPLAQTIPFGLSADSAERDISREWWLPDQLGIRVARTKSPLTSGEKSIAWRILPSGESGAVLRGKIRLSQGELLILQAIVIFRASSGWTVTASPMSVRYISDDGKNEEIVSASAQKGRWHAFLDNRDLLIAGWTSTALNAARERLADYSRDEDLRRTLKTCGEVVFKITPK